MTTGEIDVSGTRRSRKFVGQQRRPQYEKKSVRAAHAHQFHVTDEWEAKGWKLVGREEHGSQVLLEFEREGQQRRWGRVSPKAVIAALVVSVLVAVTVFVVVENGSRWTTRYEAWTAAKALKSGDLDGLGERLAGNRGNPDFAYYFTSGVSPRDLGDALATVAGTSRDKPLKPEVDPHGYDVQLADLAGVLALATHGVGKRALPQQWADDFVTATTRPSDLYEIDASVWDKIPLHKTEGEKRRDQDIANRSNLLLLLSRGYWSTDFLKTVTEGYYTFDREQGEDAWPDVDPNDDTGYAPAPNGAYLTDGVLALTAALSGNSSASTWAFTEFQPQSVQIEDVNHKVGAFTHYLMFEHAFPEDDGEGIGVTAALTALSAAVDPIAAAEGEASTSGPLADIAVLTTLAEEYATSRCSWNPLNYGHCALGALEAVWRWIKRWGHLVLDILTVTISFAPPPFNLISAAPATLNATWYAIEDDYLAAGLSLAAVAPGIGFRSIAKGVTTAKGTSAGTSATKSATQSDKVAGISKLWRARKPWRDCDLLPPGGIRIKPHPDWTRAQRKAADAKVKAIAAAAQRGELKKTLVQRSGTPASVQFAKAGKSIPPDHDIDHVLDLQLGGTDDLANMRPLDRTVNRSLGKQIELQLKHLDYGTPIVAAAIC